MHLTFNFC